MITFTLTNEEYGAIKKVLKANPPAKVSLKGEERCVYRKALTKILREDYNMPETDNGYMPKSGA